MLQSPANEVLTRSRVGGGRLRGRYSFSNIVLQPTSFCNLDCSYCYLPLRHVADEMDIEVCRRVALSLAEVPQKVLITWHGGEPLAMRKAAFLRLIQCFEPLRTSGRIEHVVQTNGTLIDAEWCAILRDFRFHVGVSVDGPELLNSRRLTRAGRSSFKDTMSGIAALTENLVSFTIIAVVGREALREPESFYEFFAEIGCRSLGINFADVLNFNSKREEFTDIEVRAFWERLFRAWQKNPIIAIREFTHALSWVRAVLDDIDADITKLHVDLFPTVDSKGNVTLLSPEFVNSRSARYADFLVGNLLERDLLGLLDAHNEFAYVTDFMRGRAECQELCPYFESCGGGNAASKYFEHGTTSASMTMACRRQEMLMIDSVLRHS